MLLTLEPSVEKKMTLKDKVQRGISALLFKSTPLDYFHFIDDGNSPMSLITGLPQSHVFCLLLNIYPVSDCSACYLISLGDSSRIWSQNRKAAAGRASLKDVKGRGNLFNKVPLPSQVEC